MPEALSLNELKSRCEDEQLMTLSDDDDALTLHCIINQQVSELFYMYILSQFTDCCHINRMFWFVSIQFICITLTVLFIPVSVTLWNGYCERS